MKIVRILFGLLWLISRAGISQSAFSPNPENATLYLYTEKWVLWHASKAVTSSFPRTAYETQFYLQRHGEQTAKLIYKAIDGQIQSFSPIWVHHNGTVIGWDVNFNYLADAVEPAETEPSLPNSLYYPVLVLCTGEGVVLMANNEQTSTDVNAPLYFLPWSYDRNVVQYRSPRLITDSVGMAFYAPRICSSNGKILSIRPPYFFLYDIGSGRLEKRQVDLPELSGMIAFDGETMVFKNGSTLYSYSFKTARRDSVTVTDGCTVLACRGNKIYCVQEQALTKSDSLNLALESYDLDKAVWTVHTEVFRRDLNEETGMPVYMILKDRMKLWTSGRWFELRWEP